MRHRGFRRRNVGPILLKRILTPTGVAAPGEETAMPSRPSEVWRVPKRACAGTRRGAGTLLAYGRSSPHGSRPQRAGLLRFVSAEPPEPSRNGAPGELVAVLSKTGVTVVV